MVFSFWQRWHIKNHSLLLQLRRGGGGRVNYVLVGGVVDPGGGRGEGLSKMCLGASGADCGEGEVLLSAEDPVVRAVHVARSPSQHFFLFPPLPASQQCGCPQRLPSVTEPERRYCAGHPSPSGSLARADQTHSRNCVIPAQRIYQAQPPPFWPHSLGPYHDEGPILDKNSVRHHLCCCKSLHWKPIN